MLLLLSDAEAVGFASGTGACLLTGPQTKPTVLRFPWRMGQVGDAINTLCFSLRMSSAAKPYPAALFLYSAPDSGEFLQAAE
jgi:hypothetical protein